MRAIPLPIWGTARPAGVLNWWQRANPLDHVPNLTANYDASNYASLTLSGSEVTQIENVAPNGTLPLKATGKNSTTGANYDATHSVAGDQPAFDFHSGFEGYQLWNPATSSVVEAQIAEMWVVAAYKDGVDSTFDGNAVLFSDGSQYVLGDANKSNIRSAGILDRVSIDGGAFSNAILPLTLSVLRFSADDQGLETVGLTDFAVRGSTRGWQGPVCQALATSAALSSEDAGHLLTALQSKWGLT